MIRRLRRCGHAPGAISPEDQAVVDEFRAMLTALRNPGRAGRDRREGSDPESGAGGVPDGLASGAERPR
ncbi:hypothetical protein [Streptomyces halstedii]|uniref:hypothetical protein n=1 Tax=Streptomyces halstedii TaxID=1944 RepID=UPI0033B2FB2F